MEEMTVNEDEKIIRYILTPKHIDPDTDGLVENFVTLRQDEDGVSCIRFDYIGGEKNCIADGNKFANVFNKPKKNGQLPKKLQSLYGWASWNAKQILDLDRDVISFSVDSSRPCHVLVQFAIDGEVKKGLVKDAKILDLFEQMQEVMVIERV